MDYWRQQLRLYFKSEGDNSTIAAKKLGYSKQYMSMFLSTREINFDFIMRLIGAYPNIDLNKIFKSTDIVNTGVNEPSADYKNETEVILYEIEDKIRLLREKLSQK